MVACRRRAGGRFSGAGRARPPRRRSRRTTRPADVPAYQPYSSIRPPTTTNVGPHRRAASWVDSCASSAATLTLPSRSIQGASGGSIQPRSRVPASVARSSGSRPASIPSHETSSSARRSSAAVRSTTTSVPVGTSISRWGTPRWLRSPASRSAITGSKVPSRRSTRAGNTAPSGNSSRPQSTQVVTPSR